MTSSNTTENKTETFDAFDCADKGSARGFPLGYFVIRSVATGKVLDLPAHATKDGSEVILYEEKENFLVEGMRKPEADNQVFFIDESGALASKHSGHAVDVEDGRLVLRHRRPIMAPYPNHSSHTLPKFSYDPVTGQIAVTFDSDPAFPPPPPPLPKDDFEMISMGGDGGKSGAGTPPSPTVSKAWKTKSYLLTSIPSQKPRTFVDDASEFFTSSASFIAAPFSSLSMPFGASEPEKDKITKGEEDAKPLDARVSLEHVRDGQFDLLDSEVLEEERPEETEVDDNPDPMRRVKVVGYRRLNDLPNSKARDRRRWEILPIRKERRRY